MNEFAYAVGALILGILDLLGMEDLRLSMMEGNTPVAIGYFVIFLFVTLFLSVIWRRNK
jgi:hypothetical protein